MMDLVQFKWKFRCPCCLSPGETFAISATGNSHIYPYQPGSYDRHDKLRTSEDTFTTGQKDDVEYLEGRRQDPVPEMGVKGVSFLMTFPKFYLIKGRAKDNMHCIDGFEDDSWTVGRFGTQRSAVVSLVNTYMLLMKE